MQWTEMKWTLITEWFYLNLKYYQPLNNGKFSQSEKVDLQKNSLKVKLCYE